MVGQIEVARDQRPARVTNGTDVAFAPDPALVQRIRQEIRLDDRSALTTYGEEAQRGVAAFADTILRDMRSPPPRSRRSALVAAPRWIS